MSSSEALLSLAVTSSTLFPTQYIVVSSAYVYVDPEVMAVGRSLVYSVKSGTKNRALWDVVGDLGAIRRHPVNYCALLFSCQVGDPLVISNKLIIHKNMFNY